MLFVNDIILIDDTKNRVNHKLENRRDTLKFKDFRLTRSKTEYLGYKFHEREKETVGEVFILDIRMPKVNEFKSLGSIMQGNGEIDDYHRIKVGWKNWRRASGVLCNKRIPLKLQGKVY